VTALPQGWLMHHSVPHQFEVLRVRGLPGGRGHRRLLSLPVNDPSTKSRHNPQGPAALVGPSYCAHIDRVETAFLSILLEVKVELAKLREATDRRRERRAAAVGPSRGCNSPSTVVCNLIMPTAPWNIHGIPRKQV
jgi:hypothetical protein